MQSYTIWNIDIIESQRTKSLEIVRDITSRLIEPEHAEKVTILANSQFSGKMKPAWKASSLPYGHTGLALLFSQMDRCFPKEKWDQVAHNYLAAAVQNFQDADWAWMRPGIFGGLSGLCFTAFYLSHNGTRYQKMLETLDNLLLQKCAEILSEQRTFYSGVSFEDYDLIAGPAGIASYLLLRRDKPEIEPILAGLLDRLILMSRIEDEKPPFFIPPERQATEGRLAQYPHGSVDCGLAHGVPGPLALFSLTRLNGIDRPGLSDSIYRLANWLISQTFHDEFGVNWPHSVSPATSPHSVSYSRAAWCYGSPGVARSLWLAGCALGDSHLQDIAVDAIHAIDLRPVSMRHIPSPILCHGVAGLLEIVLRFSNEKHGAFLHPMVQNLLQELLDLFDPELPVGFQDIEPNGNKVDNVGFLEGAAGITLVLLAAVTTVEPTWDRIMLLS